MWIATRSTCPAAAGSDVRTGSSASRGGSGENPAPIREIPDSTALGAAHRSVEMERAAAAALEERDEVS
jgi:hypothetical protein